MFSAKLMLLAVPLGWVAYKNLSVAHAATPAPGQQKFTVTGHSGTIWEVRRVKTFAVPGGTQSFNDVFSKGARILRYSQIGSQIGTRAFIDTPLAKTDKRLKAAAADFGVIVPSK